ncbi:MAG: response regulator [Proteobacteria bacterium]|nr:response regulator [Pseudomonadota bacterium]
MRVLIIDDDNLVRATLARTLLQAGHEVIEAANGNEGLLKFDGRTIDLVITDILMPEKEGLETIRELRRSNAEVKIIAISGGDRVNNLSYLSMAAAFGADDTLAKPYRLADLLAKIDAVMKV